MTVFLCWIFVLVADGTSDNVWLFLEFSFLSSRSCLGREFFDLTEAKLVYFCLFFMYIPFWIALSFKIIICEYSYISVANRQSHPALSFKTIISEYSYLSVANRQSHPALSFKTIISEYSYLSVANRQLRSGVLDRCLAFWHRVEDILMINSANKKILKSRQ